MARRNMVSSTGSKNRTYPNNRLSHPYLSVHRSGSGAGVSRNASSATACVSKVPKITGPLADLFADPMNVNDEEHHSFDDALEEEHVVFDNLRESLNDSVIGSVFDPILAGTIFNGSRANGTYDPQEYKNWLRSKKNCHSWTVNWDNMPVACSNQTLTNWMTGMTIWQEARSLHAVRQIVESDGDSAEEKSLFTVGMPTLSHLRKQWTLPDCGDFKEVDLNRLLLEWRPPKSAKKVEPLVTDMYRFILRQVCHEPGYIQHYTIRLSSRGRPSSELQLLPDLIVEILVGLAVDMLGFMAPEIENDEDPVGLVRKPSGFFLTLGKSAEDRVRALLDLRRDRYQWETQKAIECLQEALYQIRSYEVSVCNGRTTWAARRTVSRMNAPSVADVKPIIQNTKKIENIEAASEGQLADVQVDIDII